MHMHASRREWTADDLLDMPDDGQRYEVIDGELFVTPAPSLNHQAALGILHVRLMEYLARERVGYAFFRRPTSRSLRAGACSRNSSSRPQ